MDQSQKRVRPGFLLGLLIFLTAFGWLVTSGVPTEKQKIKAETITEMCQSREIATVLNERAMAIGGITNISQEFILNSLFVPKEQANVSGELYETKRQRKSVELWFKTNTSGEVIDRWQTPYRITLSDQTNFIVRSAGHNLKFDDDDDLVFDSLSKTFLKNPLQ